MNTEEHDPTIPPEPKPEPKPEQNNFMPPAPGQYQHQPHEQFEEPMKPTQSTQPTTPLEVDERIKNRKKQAKMFMVAAGVFSLLAILGLIFVIVSFSDKPEPDSQLTVNEQLIMDANAVGLGAINYNNGDDVFEVAPNKVSEFRVSYLPKDFNDPRTGEPYVLTTAIPAEGEIQYIAGGVCNEDDSIRQSGEDDNFAIRVLLTDSDGAPLHCIDKSEVKQVEAPAE